jgi:hypothetical protein
MRFLEFDDHLIPYQIFLDDLAARLEKFIVEDRNDPEYISQNKAFHQYGRGNVERWKKEGKLKCYKRPGKVEYLVSDLKLLKRTEQDYLGNKKK